MRCIEMNVLVGSEIGNPRLIETWDVLKFIPTPNGLPGVPD